MTRPAGSPQGPAERSQVVPDARYVALTVILGPDRHACGSTQERGALGP